MDCVKTTVTDAGDGWSFHFLFPKTFEEEAGFVVEFLASLGDKIVKLLSTERVLECIAKECFPEETISHDDLLCRLRWLFNKTKFCYASLPGETVMIHEIIVFDLRNGEPVMSLGEWICYEVAAELRNHKTNTEPYSCLYTAYFLAKVVTYLGSKLPLFEKTLQTEPYEGPSDCMELGRYLQQEERGAYHCHYDWSKPFDETIALELALWGGLLISHWSAVCSNVMIRLDGEDTYFLLDDFFSTLFNADDPGVQSTKTCVYFMKGMIPWKIRRNNLPDYCYTDELCSTAFRATQKHIGFDMHTPNWGYLDTGGSKKHFLVQYKKEHYEHWNNVRKGIKEDKQKPAEPLLEEVDECGICKKKRQVEDEVMYCDSFDSE